MEANEKKNAQGLDAEEEARSRNIVYMRIGFLAFGFVNFRDSGVKIGCYY